MLSAQLGMPIPLLLLTPQLPEAALRNTHRNTMLLSSSLQPHLNSRGLSSAPSPAKAHREQLEIILTKAMSSPIDP